MSRASLSVYDRHITIFSPEGKLYQVEYAFRAVKNCNLTAIAIKGAESACIVVQKKIPLQQAQQDTLLDLSSVTSLYNITDEIGCVMIGIPGDSRSIIFRAREAATRFKYQMEYNIPPHYLCQKIANLHQMYTQHAYARLHACCGIIIAVDEELNAPVIYQFDPAGWFAGYHACAAGTKEPEATNVLEKVLRNKQLVTVKETVQEAIATLQSILSLDFKPGDIEVGVVSIHDPYFRRLDESVIEQHLNAIAERD